MIQYHKQLARRSNTSVEPARLAQGVDNWGSYAGRLHYSLEMSQHPQRARMCGFGDKDRRPLAPAAVVKLIVKDKDNNILDVDDVDCSFFIVTADLWSSNGKQEMNLVLHPSSADRYPTNAKSSSRRRGASTTTSSSRSDPHTPVQSRATTLPSPYNVRANDTQSATLASLVPGPAPPYTHSGFAASSLPPPSISGWSTYSEPGHPTWGYPLDSPSLDPSGGYPPPILPSIHQLGRITSPLNNIGVTGWSQDVSPSDPTSIPPFPFVSPTQTQSSFDSLNVDPVLRSQPPSVSDGPNGHMLWPQPNTSSPLNDNNSAYATVPFVQPATHSSYQPSSAFPQTIHPPPPPSLPLSSMPPRHTYTRTLVGPLSSNATRLLDEHRKPGIFFLFQDLSVRTEGTFRLRLRLMNVGAPPAPDIGSDRVHTDVSPILAQTFTEPFIVYSAKRFPGVPDTTALSIAFGNQGMKIPLRNRHGSNKRRSTESDGSDRD